MQEININKHSDIIDDQIDLKELFFALIKGKWVIISLTATLSIAGLIYSLSLPNIYESKAIIVPAKQSSGISGALRAYGGLAGIAGINLSSNSGEGNAGKALKTLSSLSFFENRIINNIFLPDLMAVKSWDLNSNELRYDESIYKSKNNTWVRDFSFPKKQIPSAQESFRTFKTKHLNVSEDKSSGFITVSIKHQSPFIAKQWAELIINEVNAFYREKDKLESEKAVSYLNKQISMTSLSEIKQVIAELLQEETQKLTLIEANQSYVFDYIDPPAVMEQKSEPRRAIICILSAIFGGVLGIFIVLIRHYFLNEKIA